MALPPSRVLILLVACFNFTNLATARAMMRAREISLRKVVGARREQLVVQFLGESVLIALDFARAGACACRSAAALVRPRAGKAHRASIILSDWPLTLALLGIAVADRPDRRAPIPPWCCRASVPPRRSRNNSAGQPGSGLVRTVLVVLQFAVSIGLGIAALVVFAQISFARDSRSGPPQGRDGGDQRQRRDAQHASKA